ncbi:Secreted protein [Rhodotorula toruloides]|uniref:Secreted protein n=1 Tax=Rhodotorula toruloides TaxID=5286 RepID=A0A0K3CJG9_RHOTO|nr:Secreted protein [Rhodotorula toruloides]PRQ73387.1 secreted protein [Rhodotorula toruloides]
MHFSLLSLFALALAATGTTGTTAKSSSTPTKAVKTCSPPKSDYLWNVLAYKNHNIGFQTSSASHVRLATRVTGKVNTHENLLWNVVPASKGVHHIETTTGKCLISHGKKSAVTLGSCKSPSADWEISCTKCGKTACGDEFADECVVKSRTHKGQCVARVNGGLRELPCDAKSKVQLWDFTLA